MFEKPVGVAALGDPRHAVYPEKTGRRGRRTLQRRQLNVHPN